jgi:hypothetical protein
VKGGWLRSRANPSVFNYSDAVCGVSRASCSVLHRSYCLSQHFGSRRSLRGLLEPVGFEDRPQPWTDLRLSLFINRSDRFPIVKAGEFRSGAPLALGAHGLHEHQDKHHRQEGCGTHDCGCWSLQLHLTATTSCLITWGTNVSGGRILRFWLLRRREEEEGGGRIPVLGQSCLRKGSSENELQWLPCPA